MIIKNAVMLCVGNKDWTIAKNLLVEASGKDGERIVDIANKAFEKYKNEQKEDIYLVGYVYYGDVEVI